MHLMFHFDFNTNNTYGPFPKFAGSVWIRVFGDSRGLSYALRVWDDEMGRQKKLAKAAVDQAMSLLSRDLSDRERYVIEARFREYSPFVFNMKFRHPRLWRKLRTLQ
jgi:hypothetical protein